LTSPVATGVGGQLSPEQDNFQEKSAFDLPRRRQTCDYDAWLNGLWCLPDAQSTCSSRGDGYTRWVLQVDGDTEYICIPSSCRSSDIEDFWTWSFRRFDLASSYCTLECPEIQFDVHGTSDDNQIVAVNGTYRYADLSYECAGATAVAELTICEESFSCPSNVNGFKTCIEYTEELVPTDRYHLYPPWRKFSKSCLPDECTDKANLEKLEDFSYAMLWYDTLWYYDYYYDYYYGYDFNKEVREIVSISWSCEDAAEGKEGSNPLYSTFGLIIGALVLCFLGALCFLRIRLSREVTIAQVISVEPQYQEKSGGSDFVTSGSGQSDRTEIAINQVNEPSDSSSVHPIQTKGGTQGGEVIYP